MVRNKAIRSIAVRDVGDVTTPSPRLVRGRLPTAFSLARPRSGDVPAALETSGDAVAAFVFRFFLARVRAGVVGVAKALATGPRGTTAARHGERGANTPDRR